MDISKRLLQVKEYVTDEKFRFRIDSSHGKYDTMEDEKYLRKKFKVFAGYELNLDNPVTYGEKLQWLKLHDRKDIYSTMVDKYRAKEFVSEKIGGEYVVPLLGVWDDPEDIDFDSLPDRFVLKCNHNSGKGMCICRDKEKLNIEKVKSELRKGLDENYYLYSREWPYKNVKPRIIAEEYLESTEIRSEQDKFLTDYKFFCFNGEPKIMYLSKDNSDVPRTDFFDMDFNHLEMRMKDPNSDVPPEKPADFELMKRMAAVLSEGIPHLRVDFYSVNGQVYVGEMTFYHNGGFGRIYPEKWEKILGDWIVLPNSADAE